MMRSKLVLSSTAALVLGAGILAASVAPASADGWRHRHGWGPAAVAGGIVGGVVAAATAPLWAPGYYGYNTGSYGYNNGPGYGYGSDYANGYGPNDYDGGAPMVERRSAAIDEPMGDSVAYCEAHFRSYDSSTGTYLGYDGVRHSCP
jgi:BA14K-like protein